MKEHELTKLSPYEYFDFILNNTKLTNFMKKMSLNEWLKSNISKDVIDYLKAFILIKMYSKQMHMMPLIYMELTLILIIIFMFWVEDYHN